MVSSRFYKVGFHDWLGLHLLWWRVLMTAPSIFIKKDHLRYSYRVSTDHSGGLGGLTSLGFFQVQSIIECLHLVVWYGLSDDRNGKYECWVPMGGDFHLFSGVCCSNISLLSSYERAFSCDTFDQICFRQDECVVFKQYFIHRLTVWVDTSVSRGFPLCPWVDNVI